MQNVPFVSLNMQKKIPYYNYWISTAIFLSLFIICFLFYIYFKNNLVKEFQTQIQVSGSLAAQDFARTVDNNILSIENLKGRIEESNGEFFKYFESDASRIIDQNPGLQFIEWIDNNGIIQRIIFLQPNIEALNFDNKKITYRYPDWLEASKDSLTNITKWTELTQGGHAFLIDVPLYYNNSFQGTITAGMDFKTQFDKLGAKLQGHAILIKDEKGNIFYSFNNPKPENFSKENKYNTLMNIGGIMEGAWSFQFLYQDENFIAKRGRVMDYAFLYGLVLCLLSSFLVFFYLKARIESLRLKTANINLNNLNKALEKQKEKASKASLAKTQFLSNMSHEIRTPLSAIVGITEIINKDNFTDEEKKYLKLLRYSSNTLLDLVNDILDIDKIESGKTKLSQDKFSSRDLIENILKTFQSTIEEKGLTLKSTIPKHTKYMVLGDRSKMEQIFNNLIGNAIKFTNNGNINVVYSENIKNNILQLQCIIKDTGIGIPEDKLNSIYDRFVQIDNGVTKKHGGGGLGLAITKELVELLDGDIYLTSVMGKGTTFKVQLSFPLHETEKTKTNKLTIDLSYLNVLIVDDNNLNRIILKKTLQKMNIVADTAIDGSEALKYANEKKYDLIFMDVHMPERDGFEISSIIRAKNKDVIILGLSADVTKEAIEKGFLSGMNDYLTKPIEQEKLFAIIANYFETKDE